ncbi:MAG: hypothetical protein ALAOOOJD_04335 [bacterium]|nr:hypothetical protein [bacterium]
MRSIGNNDWALYAGVEFGGHDYPVYPDSMELEAASASAGGVVEVWLDSIDTGKKIAECHVENTGGSTTFKVFSADVDSVSGRHDVYLKFLGTGAQELFRIRSFRFSGQYNPRTAVDDATEAHAVRSFSLQQNYPNPFNPATQIAYSVARHGFVSLKVFNLQGQEVATLFEGVSPVGNYSATFDGKGLASGLYVCRLEAADFSASKKLMLLK